MSHSLVTFHLIWLVFLLLPSTNYSEWGHTSLTSGHYYPVIMCCSAWLHLLFLVDSLMLEESNFTWWMIIRLGEAISASCVTSELCTTKSHRCLNQLPTIPAFSNQLYTLGIIARGVRTFRLFDFSTFRLHVHEDHPLRRYLLAFLNQIGCQSLRYNVVMKNCWLLFKQHRLDNWFMGLRAFMITQINRHCSSGPHFVCWQQ